LISFKFHYVQLQYSRERALASHSENGDYSYDADEEECDSDTVCTLKLVTAHLPAIHENYLPFP
jgi:hypothetical protein